MFDLFLLFARLTPHTPKFFLTVGTSFNADVIRNIPQNQLGLKLDCEID